MLREESLDPVSQRHLKLIRHITAKAVEALRSMPIGTAGEAIRAIDVAIRLERTVLAIDEAESTPSLADTIQQEFDARSRALTQKPKSEE
jgi:hypothetical protein